MSRKKFAKQVVQHYKLNLRHPDWAPKPKPEWIAFGLKINTYNFMHQYRVRRWW